MVSARRDCHTASGHQGVLVQHYRRQYRFINAAAFLLVRQAQGNNAPVGETTAFAYTTALNTLLAKDSRQKMVGDAHGLLADKATQMEESFIDFWQNHPRTILIVWPALYGSF